VWGDRHRALGEMALGTHASPGRPQRRSDPQRTPPRLARPARRVVAAAACSPTGSRHRCAGGLEENAAISYHELSRRLQRASTPPNASSSCSRHSQELSSSASTGGSRSW
jgi:hypothetical protein